MIKITQPWIEHKNGKSRCYCDIFIEKNKKTIWFEVEEEYGDYLCTERADAYVIGMLNWAMRENKNIKSEIPVTEELLYSINTILIPSLAKYSKNLNHILVEAPVAPPLTEGKAVGTGCSCGIDSFDAIYNHMNSYYKGMDLTHLCINNVGAFNECYSEYGEEKVKEERYIIADNVSNELGLKLIKTDSNFGEEIKQNHYLTNTYSGVFAIYMLQKFWKVYYLASAGLDYSEFTIINNDSEDSAHYDLLSLQCFSHAGLKIFSEGGEKTRLEKTKNIADFKIAKKYLHVCTSKSTNCGLCSKCRRTLVTLDLLNKLEDFYQVFDIEYYKKNKKLYYKWLCSQYINNDTMNKPVYQEMMKRKEFRKIVFTHSIKSKLKFCLKKSVKNVYSKVDSIRG